MHDGALFNLKAVVQQTGLKPDTLRAWERRYGLPAPVRSGGRHRLYSRRDIDTLRWLVARQQEGLSISRAADLWRRLEAEGLEPLQAQAAVGTPAVPWPGARVVGHGLEQLRDQWLAACLAYDERQAEEVLVQAFSLYPPETVCLDLLGAAIARVGDLWLEDQATVQQEHFASEVAVRRLESLLLGAPPPSRSGRILIAGPPQERHGLGLLVLAFLLRRRGWAVTYLGADVPLDRLSTTVSATRPGLLILAAQRLQTAATLWEVAEVVQGWGVLLAYGGGVFNGRPELQARIRGHFLGETLESAVFPAESLLHAPRPAPAAEPVPEWCHPSRDHYLERRGLVDAQLEQALAGADLGLDFVRLANHELSLSIGAALTLGDLRLLGGDLGWIERLVQARGMPPVLLLQYLSAYTAVAEQHLDGRGCPIMDWLRGWAAVRAAAHGR